MPIHCKKAPAFILISLGLALLASDALGKGRPEWCTKAPGSDLNYLYFSGFTSSAKSLDDCRGLAESNALNNLVNHFGVTVQSNLSSDTREKDGDYTYSHKVSLEIQGRQVPLTGWKVIDTYHKGKRKKHDCCALLAYPKSEYAKTQELLKQAEQAKATTAINLYRQGTALLAANNATEALSTFQRAFKSASELPALTVLDDPVIKTVSALKNELAAGIDKAERMIGESWKTVAVHVLMLCDGELVPQSQTTRNITSFTKKIATENGFRISRINLDDDEVQALLDGDTDAAKSAGAKAKADWLLVVVLDNSLTSEDMQIYYMQSTGRVELVQANSGRSVHVERLDQVKGASITKTKAMENGVSQLESGIKDAASQCLKNVGIETNGKGRI